MEGGEFWYPSCNKCNRKVNADSGSYYCDDYVRHVYQIVPRYLNFLVSFSVCVVLWIFIVYLPHDPLFV